MSADFSRVRLNPLLNFAGVELKQGGVLLDADANELMAIVDRRLRALASDTLGRATVSQTTPDAFKISVAGTSLLIGKGRLYVDGLLAENHGAGARAFDDLMSEAVFVDPTDYSAQPYLPNAPALPGGGQHLVYLDVWNRSVTQIEDPNLVEIAVGVETSSRVQTVWQVRILDEDAGTRASCESDLPGWDNLIAPSTGVLTTGTFDGAPVDDPCELPPTGGYRGLENQLYRVEIHDAGQPGAGATFMWSRENASVVARVSNFISDKELELQTLGRDDVLRFNSGDWVEITDDVREFSQQSGQMRQITVDDATRRIRFSSALPAEMLPASFPDSTFSGVRGTRMRLWNQRGLVFRTDSSGTPVQVQDLDAGPSGVIDVPAAGTTLLLENGVTVSFDSTGAKGFRAGDYWVFAARTADASVELLERAPPRGIHHHYARLGIWDVTAGTVTDCRHQWPPAGDKGHDCSCTACVTLESHQSGRFTIQDAVNQVSQTGGTVCIGPGEYALKAPVQLNNARSVRIRGQGTATLIVSAGGVFALRNCVAVAIENLAIVSLGRASAIGVHSALGLALRQLVIAVLGNDARGAAISLEGIVAGASMGENLIIAPSGIRANDSAAPRVGDEKPAGFLLTAALAIEDNLMSCGNQAVTLSGTVLHLLNTRIQGNEVLGCRDVAISALGLGAPGSSLNVDRNSLNIGGSGIRCGVDGVWIEGNKIYNSATDDINSVGISLATGLDPNGADQCQLLANQVHGFGSAGISIGSPTADLIVKLNIIENCGNGIVATDDAKAGSVSIENNHLRDIGGDRAEGATTVIGIQVMRAEVANIVGNTIRALAVSSTQAAVRAAILALGVQRAKIFGNEVSEIGPVNDMPGIGAGIVLLAPYLEFNISHNQVQRDTLASAPSSGNWWALLTAGADGQQAAMPVGNFATVSVDSARVLVLGARPYVATLADAAASSAPEPARGSVIGNTLSSRGATPTAQIDAPGECLFNDNRVDSHFNQRSAAVVITTKVAIVNANRVRSGERSIQVIDAPGAAKNSAAVLGNITSGSIDIPGGLQPPWHDLNLRA
jgi:Family of unknown function (DUF6519)/Right handed beta helix region